VVFAHARDQPGKKAHARRVQDMKASGRSGDSPDGRGGAAWMVYCQGGVVLAEGRWYWGVAVLLRRRCWSSHCGGMNERACCGRAATAQTPHLRPLRPRISI
jgi:hypothetical protein